jgi:hypothetical protein
MPLKNSVKYTIGKESTPGTSVARTAVLPIRDIGSLDRAITKQEDPVIVGSGMAAGEFAVAGDVKGSIPLSPRSCPGWGMALKGALGTEGSPVQLAGIIRIKYTGSSASCKITTNLASHTIVSAKGALGSETADSSFGSAGTIDVTGAAYDTLAELVAAIDGYADYSATLVTGSGSTTNASVVAGTFQAKNKDVFLFLTSASGGAYLHRFTPDLTAGSERSTFSIQKDGYQDNYLYDGNVFDGLSITAALKGIAEADADVIGMKETAGQSANTVLTLGDSKAYVFGGGFTSIGGVNYNYVRKNSVKIKGNHREDGYGQASLDRAFHQKGMFAGEGEITLRLDSDSVLERPKVEAGTESPICLLFFAAESKKVGTSSVAECMIIEIPYAVGSESPTYESSGDALDMTLKYKAYYPSRTTAYDSPVVVSIVTSDSSAY